MSRFFLLFAFELIKCALMIVLVFVIFAALTAASHFTNTSIWLWFAAILLASIVTNAWVGWRKGK